MKNLAVWIAISIAGIVLGFIGGFITGGIEGMMMGLFAGIIMIIPIMQMIATSKFKGFLPLFFNIDDKQKFVHFPDSFGRIKTLVMDIKHDGVLYKKGIGYIDDKGSEYAWGNNICAFAIPRLGVTIDWNAAQYTHKLKEDGVTDYEDGVRLYLGGKKYLGFGKKHRMNKKPDIDNINQELDDLITEKNPEDSLERDVVGETVDFRDFASFLKYAYHPVSMENAIDTEKIWTKREQLGYKDVDRNVSRAKAIVYILFGAMIFIAVLSAMDFSTISGIFGM